MGPLQLPPPARPGAVRAGCRVTPSLPPPRSTPRHFRGRPLAAAARRCSLPALLCSADLVRRPSIPPAAPARATETARQVHRAAIDRPGLALYRARARTWPMHAIAVPRVRGMGRPRPRPITPSVPSAGACMARLHACGRQLRASVVYKYHIALMLGPTKDKVAAC